LSKHLKEAQDRLRKAFNSKIDEIQGLMAEEYAQEQRVDEAEERLQLERHNHQTILNT